MAPSFDFFRSRPAGRHFLPFPGGEGALQRRRLLRCFCKLSTWQDRRAAARPRRECAVTSIFAQQKSQCELAVRPREGGLGRGGGRIDCAAVGGFVALRMRRTPCGCFALRKIKFQGSRKSVSFCGKNDSRPHFFFSLLEKKKSGG